MSTERKKIDQKMIIEAAIDIFAKNGFEKTSIAEIAKHADIAVGSIYNYVSSKDALFELCTNYIHEKFLQLSKNIFQTGEFKNQIVEESIRFFKKNPHYAKLIMVESPHYALRSSSKRAWQQRRDVTEILIQQLKSVYNLDNLPIHANLLIYVLVAGMENLAVSWVFFNEFAGIDNYDQLIKEVKQIFNFISSLEGDEPSKI